MGYGLASSTSGWVFGLFGLVAAGCAQLSCTTRDCAEERAGQVRCVANRLETCEADGTLTYQSCTVERLVCSEKHRGCVTQDLLEGAGGNGAGAGVGGSSQTAGGTAGAGG